MVRNITPEELNKLNFPGEFSLDENGNIYYYYYSYSTGDEEPHDYFWDEYCDTADFLRKIYSGIEIIDSNSDNDSMWFTIKPNASNSQ